jgi:AsmA-like C-terminal region
MAWPPLSGLLQIGSLSAGKAVLHDVTADLRIAGNSMEIQALDGRFLNGSMHLTGALDTSGDQPKYTLDAQLTAASPAALASLFEEHWGGGQIDMSAQLEMSGMDAEQLAQSATGTLHWDWSKGGLAAQAALPASAQPLLHFDQWHGDAAVANTTFSIDHSLLEYSGTKLSSHWQPAGSNRSLGANGSAAIPLSGTISFDRDLDLKGDSKSYELSVTGTLEHPHVKALPIKQTANKAGTL